MLITKNDHQVIGVTIDVKDVTHSQTLVQNQHDYLESEGMTDIST